MKRGMMRDELGRVTALPATQRFWLAVEKTDGCWRWVGAADSDGYGWFAGFGERKAHRASYAMHNGGVPPGAQVLHTCDHPWCVRPDHLYAGTHKQNHLDKKVRGRAKGKNAGDKNGMRTCPGRSRGAANGMAKLSAADVVRIRHLREGGATYRSIASMFGVHPSTVIRVASGRGWTCVSETSTVGST